MEDYGLVSIICPMYNVSRFINRTIDCVLAQTYQNFELLIVDDISTDDSREKVLAYDDPRIKLFQNEKNSGAAESRNYAMREAKGKYIAFLDSDDIWEPTKLYKQLTFMENNGYNFSYTNYIEIDEDDNELGVFITGPKVVTRRKTNRFCYMGCLTVMYNREAVGLIQVDPEIKKRNDYAIWLKVIKKEKCYLLDETLARYRRRTGSISNVSIMTLIKHHYRLFRISEKRNPLSALFCVFRNIWFGFWKKRHFVKKYKVGD